MNKNPIETIFSKIFKSKTMNCKECELINNYPCVDYGICPQLDEFEEKITKIEANKIKHCSRTRKARTARHARMAREYRKKMTQAARGNLSISQLLRE